MIRRDDFHPVCAIDEIRANRPDVVIVHAEIAYPGGLPLQDGDFIPAFSEIHAFTVRQGEAVWSVAERNVTLHAR